MFKNNLVFRFATKAYDLAVIGGGPGGNDCHLLKDMSPPSRVHNLDSIPYVSKKEALSEEPASMLAASHPKPFLTSHISTMNSTMTSLKWVSKPEIVPSTGAKFNKIKAV